MFGEIGPIGNDYLPAVRRRIEKQFGIKPAHVLVNASHCHGVVCGDRRERLGRPDAQMAPVRFDPSQLGDSTERDQVSGLEESVLHVRHQVGPTCDVHRIAGVLAHQGNGVGDARGPVVSICGETEHRLRSGARGWFRGIGAPAGLKRFARAGDDDPVLAFDGKDALGEGAVETREGPHFPRQLIVRFDSYQQALDCYEDPEYRRAMEFAQRAYDRQLSILEG